MDKNEMLARTRVFALGIIRLCMTLPRGGPCAVISKQLVRCGTSVGANYRAACQARSRADFVSKMGIVAEEADESEYWIDLLMESKLCRYDGIAELMREAHELASIAVASLRTARDRGRKSLIPNPQSQMETLGGNQ